MGQYDKLYIGGRWQDSSSSERIEVVNPATETTIASVPAGSEADVNAAVSAAAGAFEEWSRTSRESRAEAIRRVADVLESHAPDLTEILVSEVGQPRSIAASMQTAAAIDDLRNTADAISEIVWDEEVGPTLVHRAPAGVVGAITPWNVPMKMIAMKVSAALAAGCTIVVKSTEVAPLNSFEFARAVDEAGIPAGVFNLVSGTGPTAGEALVRHPMVEAVSFTGSVRAGKRVMELAAEGVKRVSLELGGKSANVILADADLEQALTGGIEDAFRNSGQVCGGLSRVLVPRSRLSEAEEIARAAVESYVVGDPTSESTTLGPVTGEAARDRVRSYIQRGIDEGARKITGGAEMPDGLERGYFVKPTLFSADNSMRIAREEVFGPVVTIIPFEDEDDAVRLANDSSYGLAAAIWAGDRERAVEVAKRVRAGRIRINGSAINPRAPHGGFRLSGIGRELGKYGIEEFLEYQAIG